MNLPFAEQLDTARLSRIFDNKSECYKLFWFQAILDKILQGKLDITYDEIINNMIADAWYMVSEYHLNLGPTDNLEAVCKHIHAVTALLPSEKKNVILDYLGKSSDKEILHYKQILTQNVPYRLQSTMISVPDKEWYGNKNSLINRFNANRETLFYSFGEFHGLDTHIYVNEAWANYVQCNQEILKSWVKFNLITYLQRRNPNVPGIIDKLEAPQARNLDKVKKFWQAVLDVAPIHEIYGHTMLTRSDMSIDHFVPWSYVANDEFWNLSPTTRRINSSKSNNLPDWNTYYPDFCSIEFEAYQMIWQYEQLHKTFDKCAREHINSDEIRLKLYRPGLQREEFDAQLKSVLYPVYCSAKNSGFENWIYEHD